MTNAQSAFFVSVDLQLRHCATSCEELVTGESQGTMMPPGGGTVYIGNAVSTDREKMQFQLKFALDRALRAEVSLNHIRTCVTD